MSDQPRTRRPGGWRASVAAIICVARGIPLFFAAMPRTPLRVLGIIALDTLHLIRHGHGMPRHRRHALALFLDAEGCANAAWDHKTLCAGDYRALRDQLDQAQMTWCLAEYLRRLDALESRRPAINGDERQFRMVRAYREEVARLSIGSAAAIALYDARLDEGVRATVSDADVRVLFRVLMQCQIVDDALDYADDVAAGLPSFLTACASLPQSIAFAAAAARSYGAPEPAAAGILPLRLALRVVSKGAALSMRLAERRYRSGAAATVRQYAQ